MAELGLPLPKSRVAFYERTEARLGARRSQGPQHDLVWARSEAVLDSLADAMKLDRIEAPLPLLMQACANDQLLYDALRSSGILTIDRDRACFAFIHLTFQEYHLARALRATGSAAALELHWREASYEETLVVRLVNMVNLKLSVSEAIEVPLSLRPCTRARAARSGAPLNGLVDPSPPPPALPNQAEAARLLEEARRELDTARELIADCGYHRCDAELVELDAVAAGKSRFADLPPRV
jgi:hypothetical protein